MELNHGDTVGECQCLVAPGLFNSPECKLVAETSRSVHLGQYIVEWKRYLTKLTIKQKSECINMLREYPKIINFRDITFRDFGQNREN